MRPRASVISARSRWSCSTSSVSLPATRRTRSIDSRSTALPGWRGEACWAGGVVEARGVRGGGGGGLAEGGGGKGGGGLLGTGGQGAADRREGARGFPPFERRAPLLGGRGGEGARPRPVRLGRERG